MIFKYKINNQTVFYLLILFINLFTLILTTKTEFVANIE